MVDATGLANGTVLCDASDGSFPCTAHVEDDSALSSAGHSVYIEPCVEDVGTLVMTWVPPDTIEGTILYSSSGPIIWDVAFTAERVE